MSPSLLAAELLAIDPRLGGIVLRAWPGPSRDRVCARLTERLEVVRVPSHVSEDRLLGGLALEATLAAGRAVHDRGLLEGAEAAIVSMAERLDGAIVTHLCQAVDRGLAVLALDEGVDDERVAPALADRLAFHVGADDGELELPRARRVALARVVLDDRTAEALCQAAMALGIASLRAPVLAAGVARAHAALSGRTHVAEEDALVAARLVLGPRATRCPAPPPEPPPPEDELTESPDRPLEDVVLEAAASALPPGLLDGLAFTASRSARLGKSGARSTSTVGGRPRGARRGDPRNGQRLDVVATLRAAAPWQRVRDRRERLEIRRDDFRIVHHVRRTETCVVFCVDASGSSAAQRLAEAKGAVENVLADCYSRRDHVALVAFRAEAAEILLPPTRSLVRARRCLAELPGGGTTPLASGLETALLLALDARKRGQTPVLVVMTDGRANVARDGSRGREPATADALAAARAVRLSEVRTLLLDTAPRPQAQGLAAAMGARYLPLPSFDPQHL